MIKLCPTCGKEFFDRKHPNRMYCSSTCYLAAHYITLTCPGCGKQFTVTRNAANKNRRFCTRECAYRHTHHPRNPQNSEQINCKQCGKQFTAFKSRKRRFCSRECQSQSIRKSASFVELCCAVCGKAYQRHKCFTEGRKSNYCSRECRDKALVELRMGERNANYRGGAVPYRGRNWPSQRKKALRRDGYTCQICGYRGKPGRRKVDAHHIVPYRQFNGDYESANRIDNLVTLCKKCHGKVEAGKLACPKPLL